jgi:hypothetical protein
MQELLKEKAMLVFGGPVNSPKECNELSERIFEQTSRKVSPTTLRRFFGLLPSTSAFSTYVLDSISIYCGSEDFRNFCDRQSSFDNFDVIQRNEIIGEIDQITEYTLNSIFRRSLTDFQLTIPRKQINSQLDEFIESPFTIYPIIAPGGHGKSIALAHWTNQQLKEHVCLFSPASVFISLLDPMNQASKPLQFKLSSLGNVFNVFLDDTDLDKRKLLIIVDGLDEISSEVDKLHSLVDFMFDVANRYASQNQVKIVLSTRESVWYSHLASRFEKVKSKGWFDQIDSLLESGYSNLLTLSNSEIKEIIANFNSSEELPFIYECIPWNIRELIRVPINLHYINVLFHRKASMEHITQNAVIREFMRETVFCSRFAEQKEDLIWKFMELVEKQEEGIQVPKSDMKKHYPLHLKREKAYYQAYSDLLESGLLIESREENKYGIFASMLGFKHLNFYYYLSALYQIRKNEGLDFELMQTICDANQEESLASNLLATFYHIAYENEDFETLENFCELPEALLGSLAVRLAVGTSFRENNSIRNLVINKFAAHHLGRDYFFERFVDINYLFNNFTFRIHEYLKYAQNDEPKLFGQSILYLSGFLKMDTSLCEQQLTLVKEIQTKEKVYPWPIGRKVSCLILHAFFVDGSEISDLDQFIASYTKEAYAYPNYLERGLVEFELYIMLALVLVQKFAQVDKLLSHIYRHYNTSGPEQESPLMLRMSQNSLPIYFLEYAIYKQGHYDNPDLPTLWDGAINNFAATFDDYQYLIMLNWFLVDYYTHKGNKEKAQKYFSSALDLSRFASYDFYTAFILKNDPSGKEEHVIQADEMISRSGFKRELFNFQFGPSALP